LARPFLSSSESPFAQDVRAGLMKKGQKELPSKYLYDAVGSALFEVISLLPEYGLTRAGQRILRRHADDIISHLALPLIVAELGSGSGKKTRWILEALVRRQPVSYYPIEISRSALQMVERELDSLDSLSIVGLETEYLDGLRKVALRRRKGEHVLVLFLGSSIGNLDRRPAEKFLKRIRGILQAGDALLLATDLDKPVARLIQAYDDPTGVTAAFNLNLLARINRDLGANFDLSKFKHLAVYESDKRRVEMHLRSMASQTVTIPGARLTVELRKGETIWTESSHKYLPEDPVRMAARTGFRCAAQWFDQEWPFAQNLFIPARPR
jgi:L-histidine Nalpha-methyltransferase